MVLNSLKGLVDVLKRLDVINPSGKGEISSGSDGLD